MEKLHAQYQLNRYRMEYKGLHAKEQATEGNCLEYDYIGDPIESRTYRTLTDALEAFLTIDNIPAVSVQQSYTGRTLVYIEETAIEEKFVDDEGNMKDCGDCYLFWEYGFNESGDFYTKFDLDALLTLAVPEGMTDTVKALEREAAQ